MKKRTLAIVSALVLGFGIYVGSKPDTLTASEKTELAMRARNLISRINRREFDACVDTFDDRMKATMTSETMERVFGAALSTLGEFSGVRRVIVTGKDPSLTDYSICQAKCQYEKGPAIYTILFDDKGRIGGIYLK